ncbi:ensconsin-like isoform X3, partial [Lates japonicus]
MSTSPWCPSPTGCDVLRAPALEKTEKENFIEMAEGASTLKGLRAQMAAAAQAQAEERRSLAGNSPGPTTNTPAKPQGCRPVIDGATLRIDDRLRVAKERREEAERQQVDKRSTSTMNLKQPSEAGISKRLSSSSATLIKSPDKSVKPRSSSCNRLPSNGSASKEDGKKLQVEQTGHSVKKRSSSLTRVSVGRAQTPAKPDKGTTDDQARRPPAGTVDGGVLSRLLTPTQASLARSKSAAALSAEGTDAPECHLCPRSASASPLHPPRGPVRSRSIDRQKSGMTTSVSADGALDPS